MKTSKKELSENIPSIKSDSIFIQTKTKVKSLKGPVKENIKSVFQTGSIALGYDYGFLPYTVNSSVPAQAYKTEGQIGLTLLNIPVDINFFYSSQKNIIGLNNYFRISYNADRYKDNLNNKLIDQSNAYKNKLGGLSDKRQQLMQKMAYTDYLSSISPSKWPIDTTIKVPVKSNVNNPSGLANSYDVNAFDTLSKPGTDTSGIASNTIGSTETYNVYKHKIDSVKGLYENYKKQYALVNDSIKEYQGKIDQLENYTGNGNQAYAYKNPYLSKIQNIMSGIRRFEVGLCYPNYSTFLTNNVPVRGINFEYAKNNKFIAFTYGTTVSTVLYSRNDIEGFLQNTKNAYNYFDFNNVTAGRKIISAKFGAGQKENSHAFFGFLVGKGKSTYLSPISEGYSINSKECNLVLEADIRYKLTKATYFDFILGKSSIQGSDLSYENIKSAMNEIFSMYRSNALLVKLNTRIQPTNSNLNFTFRLIDPFFKSYGTGFIRSDNMRFEVKLDQPITKKIKYTGAFRYEEDNILKLMNYKNQFYSFNNTLSLKIKRSFMIRASYTPLFRDLNSDNITYRTKNSITTGVLTFAPRSKANIQFNILYNYYLVNTDSSAINFQNLAYSHQFIFKKGFKTGLNLSWYKNSLRDSLNNNVILGVLDLGYQFINGSSITVAGKSAYKMNKGFYPGFVLKSNVKIYKTFFWEIQVEKFIVGDLFNGYDLENLKKFPYYCSTRLIFNF